MSTTVPEHFVSSFSDMIFPLAEQKGSKLRNTVTIRSGVQGKRRSFDRLGSSVAYTLTARHAPTVYGNAPHSRRWANLVDKASAEILDEADTWKMLLDPMNEYTVKTRNALGRAIDLALIQAATGNATEGEEGASSVALPAAQKVAVGGTGLTVAKLITAAQILDAGNVEPEDRVFVYNAKGKADLLNTTEVKSSDYNTVKALVQGQLNTFLGFTFIQTELIETVTDYLGIAFHKAGLGLAIGSDIHASIDPLPTMNYATAVYARMSVGAVRIEDARVVQVSYLV